MTAEKDIIIPTSSDPLELLLKPHQHKSKVPWYYAPAFLLFWFVLFFAIVIPIFFHLPDGRTLRNEDQSPGEFIAERAESILIDFERIGPKVVGSYANEYQAVQLLHDEVAKIREQMHEDLFDLEVDVQLVSGAYIHWTMLNMYQGVQNFVVKFSAKNSTSDNYLLINSHFDTKTGSPGAGDDGAMLVVMLEVLRVLATNRQSFKHPIVFLFNGAEENPLQASHGFITQHKWAKNCKALINLDSAGSGHREILFQSGPNHPWLMNYYRKHAKHPYATSMAEEMFQARIIASDTDFRIFRDYGHVPGLDFAHSYIGYIYHTKFDRYNILPRGTLQATGDNILALTRALADAEELEDTDKYSEGHTVFYDFLGLFLIYYTETTGKIANTIISLVAIFLVCFSLWRMAARSFLSLKTMSGIFGIILALHLVGLLLAFGLPLLMGVIYDAGNQPMTWFANRWLVIGLYICPALFGLSAPTLLYLWYGRNDKLTQAYKVQMILHAHCIFLSLLCIIITFMGVRTSYLLMISVFFYACTLLLNLLSTLHDRAFYWTILHIAGQILPFLYFTYLFHAFLCTLMPMTGQFGPSSNPDLLIAALCLLGTLLAMGFVIPLVNIFRYPKSLLTALLVITFVFCMIAISSVGFPYRAKTQVGRMHYMHVRRVFYEYDGSVSANETGFMLDFPDRRVEHVLKEYVDISTARSIADDCEKWINCGLPIFNHRMMKKRNELKWLPVKQPLELPGITKLTVLNKTIKTSSVRFDFELQGPPHMTIFLMPINGTNIIDWSFLPEMLKEQEPLYHIYFSYGKDNSPLKFFVELEKVDGQYDVPLMELGIAGHYVSFEHRRDETSQKFINSFPDFIHLMEWPSSYEHFIL